jgi:hypothetical protein
MGLDAAGSWIRHSLSAARGKFGYRKGLSPVNNCMNPLKGAKPDTFYVRRIREDISNEPGLYLCTRCDKISKAAATIGAEGARILVREHI